MYALCCVMILSKPVNMALSMETISIGWLSLLNEVKPTMSEYIIVADL